MYINKSLSLTEWVTLYLSLSLVICWIKQLILSGGTSKIPKIQKAAAKVFDSAEVLSSVGPDEVTAYGAAIQAGAVTEKHSNPGGTSVAVKVMKSAISFIILDEENSEVSTTYCANNTGWFTWSRTIFCWYEAMSCAMCMQPKKRSEYELFWFGAFNVMWLTWHWSTKDQLLNSSQHHSLLWALVVHDIHRSTQLLTNFN